MNRKERQVAEEMARQIEEVRYWLDDTRWPRDSRGPFEAAYAKFVETFGPIPSCLDMFTAEREKRRPDGEAASDDFRRAITSDA